MKTGERHYAALAELEKALEPLAWVYDLRVLISSRSVWSVSLELGVRMPEAGPWAESDVEVRRWLMAAAESLLAVVKRRGWWHLQVPTIEFGGTIVWPKGWMVGEPSFMQECRVRLEVTPSAEALRP